MENGLYVGLSRQLVLETGMNLVANNIANLNTPGYRAQQPLFKEFISDPRGNEDPISMVNDYGQYDITAPGPMRLTGNELDIALTGPGFIGVDSGNGEIQYTRAGNFSLNNEREIVTSAGYRVSSDNGGFIKIPEGIKSISIDQRGVITTDQGGVGQIMVHEFRNPQSLTPSGNGLYRTTEQGTEAVNTVVLQGQIEGSNVNSMLEMTRMIEVSREYQSMQRMLQNDHERQQSAIQRLGRPQQ